LDITNAVCTEPGNAEIASIVITVDFHYKIPTNGAFNNNCKFQIQSRGEGRGGEGRGMPLDPLNEPLQETVRLI